VTGERGDCSSSSRPSKCESLAQGEKNKSCSIAQEEEDSKGEGGEGPHESGGS